MKKEFSIYVFSLQKVDTYIFMIKDMTEIYLNPTSMGGGDRPCLSKSSITRVFHTYLVLLLFTMSPL